MRTLVPRARTKRGERRTVGWGLLLLPAPGLHILGAGLRVVHQATIFASLTLQK